MITNIQGKKYNLEIVAKNECFYIKAKFYIKTKHKDTDNFSTLII